jgi:hypothetical protein
VTSSKRIDEATFVGSGAGVGETGFGCGFPQAAARKQRNPEKRRFL